MWAPVRLGAVLAVASGLLARGALAHDFTNPERGIVTACWLDTRLFESLKTGPMTYCRGHLAYSPGRLDCYQFTDQVCSVVLPSSATVTQTRQPVAPALFPCPDAPPPPVCPRLGRGSIRNYFD
jgi:hypothetical protein